MRRRTWTLSGGRCRPPRRGRVHRALPTSPPRRAQCGLQALGTRSCPWQLAEEGVCAVPPTQASFPGEMPPLPGPVTNMGSETPRTSDSMRPKPSQHTRTNKYEDEPPKLSLRVVCTTHPNPRRTKPKKEHGGKRALAPTLQRKAARRRGPSGWKLSAWVSSNERRLSPTAGVG